MSKMHFHNISQEEMEIFLGNQGFVPIVIPDTYELVYAKIVKFESYILSLRVYTGINPSGKSRKKGTDAIRVGFCYKFEGEIIPVGKTQRVNRIKTWQKNLQIVIDNSTAEFRICPKCRHPMVENKGKNGLFWGCATWNKTQCNGQPDLFVHKEQIRNGSAVRIAARM